MTKIQSDSSTVKTKNIWVDVDHYYENTLSPKLVQEMEELGLSIYESEGIPRILHKDSLGKVLNDEFQILENNLIHIFRLKSERTWNAKRFLIISQILWACLLLFGGLGIGTLIEYLFAINIEYSILLVTVFCFIFLELYQYAKIKKNTTYSILTLLGLIFLVFGIREFNTTPQIEIHITFKKIIETILSISPLIIHFIGYQYFITYLIKKKIVKTEYTPLEVNDLPGYSEILNEINNINYKSKSDDYFIKIFEDEKQLLMEKNLSFNRFYCSESVFMKKNSMYNFFIIFKKNVNLKVLDEKIKLNKNTIPTITDPIFGPVYPIIYSSNKNFIHLGNLPVDEEKIATLVTEKSL